MRFPIAVAFGFISSTLSQAVSPPSHWVRAEIRGDKRFDDPNQKLKAFACFDNASNPLTQRQWTKVADIPRSQYIAGVQAYRDTDYPKCGTCWKITNNGGSPSARTIYVLVVDRAFSGIDLSTAAISELLGRTPDPLASERMESQDVDPKFCGL